MERATHCDLDARYMAANLHLGYASSSSLAGPAAPPTKQRRAARPRAQAVHGRSAFSSAKQPHRPRQRADALLRQPECHQAYTAEAVICAEGSQRTLVSSIVAIPVDAPSVAATIVGWQDGIGL